jgi:DNA-binding transcriptional regulator YhcF (GntR family)
VILNPVQWPQLDPTSPTALFDQLRVAVIDAVRDGRLPAGTRLPTVRDLAGDLGLAANTVARAYRELESAGIVETRGRQGTFVAARNPTEAVMAAAARSYGEVARAHGLGKREALGYLEAEFD